MILKKAYYNRKPVVKPWAPKKCRSEIKGLSTEEGHDKQLIWLSLLLRDSHYIEKCSRKMA